MSLELAQRLVACPKWRWMAGMLVTRAADGRAVDTMHAPCTRLSVMCSDEPGEYVEYMGIDYVGAFPSWGWPAAGSGWLPDLDDPATLGCLLSLVREALGPLMYVSVSVADGRQTWRAGVGTRCGGVGATEAEALVAALEAAP